MILQVPFIKRIHFFKQNSSGLQSLLFSWVVRRGCGFARSGGRDEHADLRRRRAAGRRNMIAGANKDDYHLRHVTPGEDFEAELHDLRQAAAGDFAPPAAAWWNGPSRKRVEIGHIFKLGYKYSESMGLRVLNTERQGSDANHGVLWYRHRAHSASAIEPFHDEERHDSAGFDCAVPGGGHAGQYADAVQTRAARRIYDECLALGSTCCSTTATNAPE